MRADLDIIQEWIPAGSRVLDLGCGNGELLAWLRDHKATAWKSTRTTSPPASTRASTSSSRTSTWAWATSPATASTWW